MSNTNFEDIMLKCLIDYIDRYKPLYYKVNKDMEYIFYRATEDVYVVEEVNHNRARVSDFTLRKSEFVSWIMKLNSFDFNTKSVFDNLIQFPLKREA